MTGITRKLTRRERVTLAVAERIWEYAEALSERTWELRRATNTNSCPITFRENVARIVCDALCAHASKVSERQWRKLDRAQRKNGLSHWAVASIVHDYGRGR